MTIIATIAAVLLVAACVLTIAGNLWNIAEALTSKTVSKVSIEHKRDRARYKKWENSYSAR